jgi:hypothetical protein
MYEVLISALKLQNPQCDVKFCLFINNSTQSNKIAFLYKPQKESYKSE